MAWTYTLVFTATAVGRRNQVRLNIGDTDTARQLLQDEEIDAYLAAASDNLVRSSVLSLRAILARWSTRPESQTVGDVSIAWSDLLARIKQLLAYYESDAAAAGRPFTGGISDADIEDRDSDTDRPVPVFHEDRFRDRRDVTGPDDEDDEDT